MNNANIPRVSQRMAFGIFSTFNMRACLSYKGGLRQIWSLKERGFFSSLKHMPTVPVVGVRKEGRTLIGPWGYLNRKLTFVELPG